MSNFSLDARQRAMLQEMGITVWAPPASVPSAEAPTARAPASAPAGAPMAAASPPAAHAASAPPAQRAAARSTTGPAAPAPVSTARAGAGATAPPANGLRLHPPQALYPMADPAKTPVALGNGWLIVAECVDPAQPLSGDAGKLLDNMLRSMQLHRHPRVFLCALERSASGAAAEGADPADALGSAVASLQPAMVLLLGHVAARAALNRTEPLGRLRAEPHRIGDCPAVVTYDPAFLLRQQDSKAAAWADLCAALATLRAQSPG